MAAQGVSMNVIIQGDSSDFQFVIILGILGWRGQTAMSVRIESNHPRTQSHARNSDIVGVAPGVEENPIAR